MESMDARLVGQALNYHGQQLQKVWEGERNENELVMLNLKDPNFEIYQQRQKTLRYIYIYICNSADWDKLILINILMNFYEWIFCD